MHFRNERKVIGEKIDQGLSDLDYLDIQTAEYGVATDNLQKLVKLRDSTKKRISISPEMMQTLVMAGVSIAEILMILYAEHTMAITSKALNWIVKPILRR